MSSIRKKLADKTTKLTLPKESSEEHPLAEDNYANGSFFQVDLDMVQPDPNQPRQYFDPEALAELSRSIEQTGILQPVLIRKDNNNTIWLVAGERRYRAAKMAGLQKIPAIITTGNPSEIALIENLQRENLKPVEEAEALQKIIEEYRYTHEGMAAILGKARSTITETLKLNRLPETIKAECRRADIYPRRLLVELAKQDSAEKMLTLFDQVKTKQLKSDELRVITRSKAVKSNNPATINIIQKSRNLRKALSKIQPESLPAEQKGAFLSELRQLYDLLNAFLQERGEDP